MTLKDLDASESDELFSERMRRIQAGEHLTFEVNHHHKQGHLFPLEVTANLVTMGSRKYILASHRDITRRKRAEEELRLESAALEAAANAIVITNRAGIIQWANPAFTNFTGYAIAEAAGRNPSELIKSGKHEPAFYKNMWDTILGGQVWHGEITNRRKNGSCYTEEMTITPVRDQRGEITHFVAIKQDITEKKMLESRLLRSQRLESVGRLASGIAHDLNNILAPMLMSAPVLRDAIKDPDIRQLVDTIESSAVRGAGVIKQLLTFSRGLEGERVPVQLKSLVLDMLNIIRETFPKNIVAAREAPANPWLVRGDATQLHQILMNLCVNARDAMLNGGKLTLEPGERGGERSGGQDEPRRQSGTLRGPGRDRYRHRHFTGKPGQNI